MSDPSLRPGGPRSPSGPEALEYHVERAVAFFREISPDASWSEIRLYEGYLHSEQFVKKQHLFALDLYRNRFHELLNEGHSWINLNVSGVLDDYLILSLEWPNYANTCPREWVSVNLSGPFLDGSSRPRWDLSYRWELVD